jgi:fatty-acyl-CoA synthase
MQSKPLTTLPALLSAAVADAGSSVATSERDGERVWSLTFKEFGAAVAHTAAEASEHGVRRGDVVGVWLPNWTESLIWEFALATLGATSLGINTRYGVHELMHLLLQGRPVGLVTPVRFLKLDFAGRLQAAIREAGRVAPDLQPPWVAAVRAGSQPTDDLDVGGGVWAPAPLDLAVSQGDRIEAVAEPHDLVNYFTTSGSTGLPKLAGHDQASVVRHCGNVVRALDIRAGDCFLAVLPLSGVFGFNPAMAMLSAGGCCLLEPVFDPALVLDDMEQFGVTHAVGGDDMLGRLMDAWALVPRPLPCFRRGGIADFAGRARAVVEWAERELGAQISGVYGSSELFALTALWPAQQSLEDRIRGGGCLVSDQIEMRIVDPESGGSCEPHTVGELQFRGYNVVQSYLGDPDAAAEAFTADGWFRSGDLGFFTGERGSFVYSCRSGDALRLRGFLVEPSDIESFLMSSPKVSGAKVVGVRAEGEADVAVAYVTLHHGEEADSSELLEYCRERLASFKVPSYLNIIDEFPVTVGTNGAKIRTAELRQRAIAQVASARAGAASR